MWRTVLARLLVLAVLLLFYTILLKKSNIYEEVGFNKNSLFKKIIDLWNLYNIKISTSKLNSWLSNTLETYSMPIMKNNIKLKIKYVKQNSSCPPTFVFFVNISNKVEINKNFEKFLTNSLRTKFSLQGIPIKIHFVFSKNPFIS